MADSKIKPKYEVRMMDIRAAENPPDDKMIIEGYAIIFNTPQTRQYGRYKFTETIQSGALSKTDMKDVPLRYNHYDNIMIMARTRNKSLQLIVDTKGLKIVAELIDTQNNRDLYKGVQAGLIDKMSFAFTVAEKGDAWQYGDTETVRVVTDINKLYDVSIVDMPFYDDTSIYARTIDLLDSEQRRLDSRREIEILKLKIGVKSK